MPLTFYFFTFAAVIITCIAVGVQRRVDYLEYVKRKVSSCVGKIERPKRDFSLSRALRRAISSGLKGKYHENEKNRSFTCRLLRNRHRRTGRLWHASTCSVEIEMPQVWLYRSYGGYTSVQKKKMRNLRSLARAVTRSLCNGGGGGGVSRRQVTIPRDRKLVLAYLTASPRVRQSLSRARTRKVDFSTSYVNRFRYLPFGNGSRAFFVLHIDTSEGATCADRYL